LCGREAGIAAILGTGSNACFYNGEQIQDTSSSLGFILGDEGGGTQIGKKLIQSFLYDQMPPELNEVFRLKYEIKREAVLDAVYHQSRPNAYLASFAKFAAEFQQHPFIEQLLESCFSDFFNNHISRYKSYTLNQIHFTGSIAVAYSSILKKVAHKNGYEFVDILSSPVERLINFHRG
jgi:N-acetylglucosamine kinase-like BadF-type ATPase